MLGRSVHPPILIEPYTGVEQALALEKLDKVKAERVSRFLWDAKTVGLKVKKVYSKTSVKSKSCLRMLAVLVLFVVIILLINMTWPLLLPQVMQSTQKRTKGGLPVALRMFIWHSCVRRFILC